MTKKIPIFRGGFLKDESYKILISRENRTFILIRSVASKLMASRIDFLEVLVLSFEKTKTQKK